MAELVYSFAANSQVAGATRFQSHSKPPSQYQRNSDQPDLAVADNIYYQFFWSVDDGNPAHHR